ncbi:RidA family protein [Pseudomonas sp. NPDC089734]|uniref:RidA family protein n=1 Tax=Pseudomonas sp. NPDC089734 TaxID=3364469 RepID=UPI00380C4C44
MAGEPIGLIHSPNVAAPGGHYSQAVQHQGLLWISGQLPIRADGSHSADEPFDTQARIALNNLMAILDKADCRAEDLLKVTVYIVGIEHWPAFDQLYACYLGQHRPARAVVPVPVLHHGYRVEIEAVARCAV